MTGFVTTTRVTHATPAAMYAKTANRNWECDTDPHGDAKGNVKDIGVQLIENAKDYRVCSVYLFIYLAAILDLKMVGHLEFTKSAITLYGKKILPLSFFKSYLLSNGHCAT